MSAALTILGWVAAGAVLGALGARAAYHRRTISAGRGARAPLCTSCPFVSEEQRQEILTGRPTECPPLLSLPDGSARHRPV